jgi:hypothetical protein
VDAKAFAERGQIFADMSETASPAKTTTKRGPNARQSLWKASGLTIEA